MAHLTRRAARQADYLPPGWKAWRGLLFVVAGRLCRGVGRLFRSHRARVVTAYIVVLVGLMGQIVLLLVASYLIDLTLSLMELWADLARKHLEITL